MPPYAYVKYHTHAIAVDYALVFAAMFSMMLSLPPCCRYRHHVVALSLMLRQDVHAVPTCAIFRCRFFFFIFADADALPCAFAIRRHAPCFDCCTVGRLILLLALLARYVMLLLFACFAAMPRYAAVATIYAMPCHYYAAIADAFD